MEKYKKNFTGIVLKVLPKTLIVNVKRKGPHRRYKKIVTSNKKFYVHDEKEIAKIGDVVEIFSGRPTSKLKRFWLNKVKNSVDNKKTKPEKKESLKENNKEKK